MSDKPETFDDICARIRKIDESMMRNLDFMAVFLEFLPKDIEAAAKRERALLDANVNRVRELEAMLDGAANTVLDCAIKNKRSDATGSAAATRKFDEAAFDAAVSKPNGWSDVADPVAEIRRMRGDCDACPMTKTQLQTISDLVAIAHDEMDGLPHHEQELERFDALLFDMKSRYALGKPHADICNAAALREALEQCGRALEKAQCSSAFQAANTGSSYITAALSSAHAALSAPARNCDVGTAADALAAYTKDRDLTLSPEAQDAIWWLFEKAEKEETK